MHNKNNSKSPGAIIGIATANNVLRNAGIRTFPTNEAPQERPLWKDLLLVTVPTFIGSVVPIIVAHFLAPDEPHPNQNVNYQFMQPGHSHTPIPQPPAQPPQPPQAPPGHLEPKPESFGQFAARHKTLKGTSA